LKVIEKGKRVRQWRENVYRTSIKKIIIWKLYTKIIKWRR